jgi:hypothetical protein
MKRKIIKDCVLYDSTCEWSYEDYLDWCAEMDETPVPEDSEAFYEFVRRQQDNDWDDFEANMGFSAYRDEPCMITGSLGLWNGRPDIIPVKCDCIWDAITKCISNSFSYECDIVLNDGHIDVNIHHHDGTNCFEIHLLSKRGIKESERPIYKWEKDYEPKRYWFKNIYGYLF